MDNDSSKTIREKIAHILKVYPGISTYMLQVGVGTSMSPVIWKPVLQEMLDEGSIEQKLEVHTSPSGRQQSYTKLYLSNQ